MAFSDPAKDYIESQKTPLLDFIFRMTGDRSRAGIIASEVCENIHRELMSAWAPEDIRIELFAYAYEINIEAARGIDKSFLENYYREQFEDAKKVIPFYALEMFLQNIGLEAALVALLHYRFHFQPSEIARIMDRSYESVEADQKLIETSLRNQTKIKIAELQNLPVYDFLLIPDYHPTDLSSILGDMKPNTVRKKRMYGVAGLVLFGILCGLGLYYYSDEVEGIIRTIHQSLDDWKGGAK